MVAEVYIVITTNELIGQLVGARSEIIWIEVRDNPIEAQLLSLSFANRHLLIIPVRYPTVTTVVIIIQYIVCYTVPRISLSLKPKSSPTSDQVSDEFLPASYYY